MSAIDTKEQPRVLGLASATGVCIASMIGMGIFTTTGVVGAELLTETNVMLAWVFAGGLALCGALSVAEIGAMRPHASSQYLFVHDSLGSTLGYLNGVVTALIGYIASIAVLAIVTGIYLEGVVPALDARITATFLLLSMGVLHGTTVVGGMRFNNVLVALKIALVLFFIGAGFFLSADPFIIEPELLEAVRLSQPESVLAAMPANLDATAQLEYLRTAEGPGPLSATVATGVVVVTFAYLGWSNSCDVGGEVKRPERNLPLSVIGSVGLVMLLYLLANIAFLRVVPPAGMIELNSEGQVVPMANLGAVVAQQIFGDVAGNLIALAIVGLLISTLSTVTMTCGRVIAAMSWKGEMPPLLGTLNKRGAPTTAIAIQTAVAVPIIWIAGLSAMLDYIGILVSIMVSITMTSIIVMRFRQPTAPRPFRVPLYPIPPLFYIAVTLWIIISAITTDPLPLYASIATLLVFLVARPFLRRSH